MSARHADYAQAVEAPLGRGRHDLTRQAIVYVPAGERWPEHADYCLRWMASHHVDMAGLVVDPDGSRWPGALAAVASGVADLVVVCRRADIPTPAVAVVEEEVADRSAATVRPHRLRSPEVPAGHGEPPGPVPPRRPKRVA